MSVTFTFAASDGEQTIIGIPCPRCDALRAEVDWADFDSPAMDAYFEHRDECPSLEHDVNLANSNAFAVMSAIGMPQEYGGVMPAQELCALIEQNCTWPNAFEGYVASRILRIYGLAVEARRRGISVGWS